MSNRNSNRDFTPEFENYQSVPRQYIIQIDHFEVVNFRTLRLYFNIPLKETDNLFLPSTYQILGPAPVSITAVDRFKHKTIDLTISGFMVSGYYTVRIVRVIKGINDTDIILTPALYEITQYVTVVNGPQLVTVDNATSMTIDATYSEVMDTEGLTTTTNYTVTTYPAETNWVGTAAALSADQVLLESSRDMTFDVDLITPANYVTTPSITITRVQISDSHNIILSTGYMKNGQNYEITVNDAVKDIDGQSINPLAAKPSFVGIGTQPRLVLATSVSQTIVDLLFDKEMDQTLAEQTGNYQITAGIITLVVSDAVLQPGNLVVRLTVSPVVEILYTVVVSNLTDTEGNLIDPLHNTTTFTGTDVAPQVASAASLDYQTLHIVFSENMDATGLDTPGNYTYTCPGSLTLTTNTATIISTTTVELTVNEEMRTGDANYTVTADGSLKDLAGNPLDPAHDSATFNGIGIAPQVSSAVEINLLHVDVTFNEPVDTTTAEIAGNYMVSGASSPLVTNASKTAPGVVRLTLAENLVVGDYTITVINVTDLAGNVIDPAHDEANFTNTDVAPQVVSATEVNLLHIDVTFDEPVETTTAETAGNYTVSGASSPNVTVALQTAPDTVRLTLAANLLVGDYTVTVINVTDLVGNAVDPAHDEADFTNTDVAPRVTLATSIDTTHIDVDFSEDLETTTAQTPGNYAVTGTGTPTVSNAVLTDTDTVRLTTSESMSPGDYTVTVTNVTDLVGNVVDPDHDEATFNVAPAIPFYLDSIVVDDFDDSSILTHASLSTGLLGFWPIGTTRQDIHTNDLGTLSSSALPVTGPGTRREATSGRFNGTTNIYSLANSSELRTAQWSVAVWFNMPTIASGSTYCIAAYGRSDAGNERALYRFTVYGCVGNANGYSGKASILWYNAARVSGEVLSSAAVAHNTWYHLVATFDGVNVKLYQDSIYQGLTAFSGVVDDTLTTLAVGGRAYMAATYYYFNGLIQDLGIWNRALTQAEINSLYNDGLGLPYTKKTDAKNAIVTFTSDAENNAALVTISNYTFSDSATIYNHQTLRTGLISYYECNGNLTDSHGQNHGQLAGNVVANRTETDRGALKFIPTSGFVGRGLILSNEEFQTTDFALSVWVALTAADATNRTIITKASDPGGDGGADDYAQWQLLKDTSERCLIQLANAGSYITATDPTAMTAGVWYHFVAQFDSQDNKLYLYKNGVCVVFTTFSGTRFISNLPIWVCGKSVKAAAPYTITDNNPLYGNTSVANIGIWNRPLTYLEIIDLYNGGFGLPYRRPETSLVTRDNATQVTLTLNNLVERVAI